MFALGLLLVLVGAALVAAEAHVPSHGVLGSGAVVALATGVALAGGAFMFVLVRKALATRRIRASNSLVGRLGVARGDDCVFVDGALWRARMWELEGDPPLSRGQPVVVEHVNGLTLTVRPAEEWEVV